jgi:predicted metal-binding membrane protein
MQFAITAPTNCAVSQQNRRLTVWSVMTLSVHVMIPIAAPITCPAIDQSGTIKPSHKAKPVNFTKPLAYVGFHAVYPMIRIP